MSARACGWSRSTPRTASCWAREGVRVVPDVSIPGGFVMRIAGVAVGGNNRRKVGDQALFRVAARHELPQVIVCQGLPRLDMVGNPGQSLLANVHQAVRRVEMVVQLLGTPSQGKRPWVRRSALGHRATALWTRQGTPCWTELATRCTSIRALRSTACFHTLAVPLMPSRDDDSRPWCFGGGAFPR
jgi:hypothetical protein